MTSAADVMDRLQYPTVLRCGCTGRLPGANSVTILYFRPICANSSMLVREHLRFGCVEGINAVADVLGAVKNPICQTCQEVSGREVARYGAHGEARPLCNTESSSTKRHQVDTQHSQLCCMFVSSVVCQVWHRITRRGTRRKTLTTCLCRAMCRMYQITK